MIANRMVAEWLNACDAVDRIADQIEAAEKDRVSASYVNGQCHRAAMAISRILFILKDDCEHDKMRELAEAIDRIRHAMPRRKPEPESTGERRGR